MSIWTSTEYVLQSSYIIGISFCLVIIRLSGQVNGTLSTDLNFTSQTGSVDLSSRQHTHSSPSFMIVESKKDCTNNVDTIADSNNERRQISHSIHLQNPWYCVYWLIKIFCPEWRISCRLSNRQSRGPGWVCGVIFLEPHILLRIMITANGDQIIHVRILLDCRDCPLQNQTMTAIIIA